MAVNSGPTPLLSVRDREIIRRTWEWSIATTTAPPDSIHGPPHWRRVSRLGLRVARLEGADMLVVALFAACHDVARTHDGRDLEHGPMAAQWVGRDLTSQLTLDERRLETLLEAITRHTDGEVSDDPTIGACWDADRLDLVRIGFPMNPAMLSTAAARSSSLQRSAARLWARDRCYRIQAGLPVPQPLFDEDS